MEIFSSCILNDQHFTEQTSNSTPPPILKEFPSNHLVKKVLTKTVADPGFSRGGGVNPPGGREHAKFSRKLHEIERIWTPRGGRASLTPPPRSANARFVHNICGKNVSHFTSHYLSWRGVGVGGIFCHFVIFSDMTSYPKHSISAKYDGRKIHRHTIT